mgnify:CR=1 FL=1|tara:strand:+ start:2125 stop:2661 length:537 start_codon:yes stop_codon:yes gene_type:complete
MSRLRANLITNQSADGAPTVSNGLVISGVTTTSEIFVGTVIKLDPVSGIVTAPAVDIDDFLDVGSNIKLGNAGVITATSFVGSGAQLTGIVGGKFNGPAAGILTTSTVGIQTADVTSADLVGAATSMIGLYIGDGSLLFSNYLNKSGGYYITTGLNALNAGPVTLGTPMTLDGTWTIV